ncbi:Crp/Fnr family transcriptional regulator [Priestia megaterium]|jgi:CRP-like cAMP-binding protein|uniref:Crp/Fnr family transcriptional regulator n=1 Tax=Priestia megaterium TaxID=1404 RepID=UPI002E1D71C4|nr:Crp/Fnr family transcriptional regulator [Priestia megaterium]
MMAILFNHENNFKNYLMYGKRQYMKQKNVVYEQGDIGEGFYYLESGLIKVHTSTPLGKERVLNIVLPGQLLGVQSMDQQAHFTTATTVKDSVLYYFSYDDFKTLITHHPPILNLITKSIIQKMHILAEQINLHTLTTEQQIAAVLLNIYHDFKNYEIPLTQKDLATCTGLTRITVYKTLKKWKEKKLIDSKNKRFLIKNPDLLKNYLFH